MASVKVTDVQVWNQNGQDATLFDPFFDAISLAAGVNLSADLTANAAVRYFVDFQLIEALTNKIVVNSFQTYQLPENWPSWWFTAGNNWDPKNYTTAKAWGFWWPHPAVFGFRAVLTVAIWTGGGFQTVDALDVSPVRWFQVIQKATL